MKAILLAAVLALPACAANADPLPDAYLGRWCYGGYDEDKKAMMYDLVATKKEWKKCREGDGYMEIKRSADQPVTLASVSREQIAGVTKPLRLMKPSQPMQALTTSATTSYSRKIA